MEKKKNYRSIEIENTKKYFDNKDHYYDNQDKFEAHCVRCGKGIKTLKFAIHEVDGGGYALHNDDFDLWVADEKAQNGDLGEQYIGTECKKHLDKNYYYRIIPCVKQ